MSLSRQVIEETNTKDRYPVFNLFCDWSLHPKLDRKDAQNILGAIEEALLVEMEKPGHFTSDTLMAAVSPRRLRNEMIALLTANMIDPTVAENLHYFVPIVAWLTEDISHKPLELTEKKFNQKLLAGKPANIIRALTLEPNTNPQIRAKFVIKADVRRYPTPRIPTVFLAAPFVIATRRER
jgi:hypothetical protein